MMPSLTTDRAAMPRASANPSAGGADPAGLHVVSLSRIFPCPWRADYGIYVLRRSQALAELVPTRFLQPVPWFPLLRPLPPDWAAPAQEDRLAIHRSAMFYLPGLLKAYDRVWLRRSVEPVLARWQQEWGVSLIDAHFGHPDGTGAVEAGQRLGLPVFITLRGLEIDLIHDRAVGPHLRRALHAATGVLAVSQNLADVALQCGVPAERVRVVHNAVDGSKFCPGDRGEARRRLGLDAHRPLIVSVGHVLEVKRHAMLVRAMHELVRRQPEAHLAILGAEGREPTVARELRGLIDQLGLEKNVRLVGAVAPDDVPDWLRAADAFSLVSAREGCCNAVLEALACGIPVVATRVGDNAHFVREGEQGHIVPVDDPGATAEALAEVLSRRWSVESVAQHVPRGWHTVAQGVLRFFQERLSNAAGLC